MTSDKKRKILHQLGTKLIATALILIGLAVIIDLSLKPVIETANAYECRLIITEIITNAVDEELTREDIDYSTLVTLNTDNEGDVTSVKSNVININRLKNSISKRLERELQRIQDVEIKIPIGTLSGLQMLHGKGFDIGMTIEPMGYPETQIISEFTEAGINQTCHRIIIRISVVADAIIPGYSTTIPVTTSIVAAETIIVGDVPDAYTHVISGDESLTGTLEDYEADIYL